MKNSPVTLGAFHYVVPDEQAQSTMSLVSSTFESRLSSVKRS